MKYIDLCCGTGAFSHVLQNFSEFECVFANDFCKESELIYKKNFPKHNFNNEDLNNISIEKIPLPLL